MKWRQLPLAVRMAVIAPLWVGLVYVALPLGLLRLGSRLNIPELLPSPYHLIGLAPLILGAAGALACVAHFVVGGRGTPVPYDPPSSLVTNGPYAYCRNPMMATQFVASFGEAIFLRAWLLVALLALLLAAAHLYLRFVEERHLIERFGKDYEEYRRNVPMWMPRLRACRPKS